MQMDGDESSNLEDRRGEGGYFGGGGGGFHGGSGSGGSSDCDWWVVLIVFGTSTLSAGEDHRDVPDHGAEASPYGTRYAIPEGYGARPAASEPGSFPPINISTANVFPALSENIQISRLIALGLITSAIPFLSIISLNSVRPLPALHCHK